VQSQSITVDRQMKRYKVPRLAFVNKMDRPGGNYERVANMLKDKLGHTPLIMHVPLGAEDKFQGMIDVVTGKAYKFEGEDGEEVGFDAAILSRPRPRLLVYPRVSAPTMSRGSRPAPTLRMCL